VRIMDRRSATMAERRNSAKRSARGICSNVTPTVPAFTLAFVPSLRNFLFGFEDRTDRSEKLQRELACRHQAVPGERNTGE